MQPVTSSSQSQVKAAVAKISNPADNQQPGTTLSRTVSSAHGLAGASTSTSQQPADDANRAPSDAGLVTRTITETQALSVHSEPLTAAFQLPAGHTYQPYFWLSRLAHRLMAPPLLGKRH